MKGGDFMNSSQEIADKIKLRAKERDVKLGAMLADIGVAEGTLRNMKNLGCMPSVETLSKIAVYLNCSLDDLCGTEDIKNNAASIKSVRNDIMHLLNRASDKELDRILGYLEALLPPSE